ncbi:S16 family serine protease [Azospirillum sp. TSO5]|uniref:S16 family serine protease n=1 Tax=Azospirillum sp. TSO5 TaxID=716760 RepID=UPI001FFFA948|nr:S16 family serine protease [Azospirillum sp. TSO5]
MHTTGAPRASTLASFIAFASGIVQKPLQSQIVVLSDISLGGSVIPVESLAECLQVAFDAGAMHILVPMSSAADVATIPAELFTNLRTSFLAIPWTRCSRRLAWTDAGDTDGPNGPAEHLRSGTHLPGSSPKARLRRTAKLPSAHRR